MFMYSGIVYKIINNVNDIIYIGSTSQKLNERFNKHKQLSNINKSFFYTEMKNIGFNNFVIKPIITLHEDNKEILTNKLLIEEQRQILNALENNIKLYNTITKINLCKKVDQFDLNDNYIQTFDSCSCIEKYLNNNQASRNISSCCNNKRKTAYGFKWKYNNN